MSDFGKRLGDDMDDTDAVELDGMGMGGEFNTDEALGNADEAKVDGFKLDGLDASFEELDDLY